MIWRCCSAASRSSVAGSFSCRASRMLRISAAVFPVAQTMKMRPKLLRSGDWLLRGELGCIVFGGMPTRCSCADQRSDSSVVAGFCGVCWPMRGWLSKASCQASSGKSSQMQSEASHQGRLRLRRAVCRPALPPMPASRSREGLARRRLQDRASSIGPGLSCSSVCKSSDSVTSRPAARSEDSPSR